MYNVLLVLLLGFQ